MKRYIKHIISIGIVGWCCQTASYAVDSSVISAAIGTSNIGQSTPTPILYQAVVNVAGEYNWDGNNSWCENFSTSNPRPALHGTATLFTFYLPNGVPKTSLPQGKYIAQLNVTVINLVDNYVALADVRVYNPKTQDNFIHIGDLGSPYNNFSNGFVCPTSIKSGRSPKESRLDSLQTATFSITKIVNITADNIQPKIEMDIYDGYHSYVKARMIATIVFTPIPPTSKITPPAP